MLKNKKMTGSGNLHSLRLAGALAGALFIFGMLSSLAPASSFGVSSARDGGTNAYIENNTFGTNRESGPAFWTDPATGARRFGTPDLPQQEKPEDIEILPIRPEVHPTVPPAGEPIVIQPGESVSP